MPQSLLNRLAVCSWSLQTQSAEELVSLLKKIGILRTQLALDPLRTDSKNWGQTQTLFRDNGISAISGMFTTVGEDYTTMETIRATGGIVPDETWDENWENVQKIAEIAAKLGLGIVTFHAGFVPEDEHEPCFEKILNRIRLIADLFASKKINLGFETGQETAPALAEFLKKIDRKNVGVNFDPANMLLYDKGNPIEALKILGPWLQQCHLKDAIRTSTPGTWGSEVAVGSGEVPWKEFIQTLDSLGFQGELALEREAGTQRVADIIAGKNHILSI